MYQNTIIIICGPTAVGKTAVAVQLAKQLETEIISADSRQCFKELNIGVAKPSEEELNNVHHYFVNSHSIHEVVNAGVFEKYALAASKTIFERRSVAVMVGGTGLYIKAFTEGMDEMPHVNANIRQEIVDSYKKNGLEYLQKQLAEKDPDFWQIAEQKNPQRLMRALEVVLSSGKSITAYRRGKKDSRPFNIIKVGLELPREELYDQINRRVDLMIEQGLVEEVRNLLPQRAINALQSVGYRELFDFFDDNVSLSTAVANIKTNTRQYAKRQMTWFKKDGDINWYNAQKSDLLQLIAEKLPTGTPHLP